VFVNDNKKLINIDKICVSYVGFVFLLSVKQVEDDLSKLTGKG
jgi:hypothetical protein